jgi:hypothetical protein
VPATRSAAAAAEETVIRRTALRGRVSPASVPQRVRARGAHGYALAVLWVVTCVALYLVQLLRIAVA